MANWKKWNNCTIFWWTVAAAAGVATYCSTQEAITAVAAIFLGLVVAALIGVGMTRVFCQGSSAGVNSGTSYTAPAIGSDTPSIVNEAAKMAAQRMPVNSAPPAAKAVGAAPTAAASKPKASKPKASKPKAAKPAPTPAPEPTPDYDGDGKLEGTDEGTKPAGLDGPRDGKADNLKEIKGIGPKLEKLCNSMGFYHFDQIAGWSADEVAWVNANLEGFKGRVTRDNWIEQAKILAAGGETEFSKRVDDGDVY